MSVLTSLYVRGKAVFGVGDAELTSGDGAQDGETRFWQDGSTLHMQVYSRELGAWTEIGAGDTYLVKSDDETVNNSATLQDDADFSFSVEASGIYAVEAFLGITTNTTADWKFAWTLPTSAVVDMVYLSSAADPSIWEEVRGVASGTGVAWAASINVGAGEMWFGRFLIRVSSTAGTAQFQWAQNTATAVDTTVHEGSYMKWRKLN